MFKCGSACERTFDSSRALTQHRQACLTHRAQCARLADRLRVTEPPPKKARMSGVSSQSSRDPCETQETASRQPFFPLPPESNPEPSGQPSHLPTEETHSQAPLLQSGTCGEPVPPAGGDPAASSSQQPLGPRPHRLHARYRDLLPEPPITPDPPAAPSITIRRVLLVVYDSFRTQFNRFGIARDYRHRPSHDLDSFVTSDDLSTSIHLPSSQPDDPVQGLPPPWPWRNMSIWRLMRWAFTGSRDKSLSEANKLVQDVLLAPDFSLEELEGFDAHTESMRMEQQASATGDFFGKDQWRQTTVDIPVPSKEPSEAGFGQPFSIDGFYHWPILDIIRNVFAEASTKWFHLTPFKKVGAHSF